MLKFPTSICARFNGALVDNKNHYFPYCKKCHKTTHWREVGLNTSNPFSPISQVQMLACLRTHESCNYVTRPIILSCFNFGLFLYLFQIFMTGEIMVKRTKGTKVKVLFQGLYMTHVIIALVYTSRKPPLLQLHFQLVFNY
jgi:hypothetical protein